MLMQAARLMGLLLLRALVLAFVLPLSLVLSLYLFHFLGLN